MSRRERFQDTVKGWSVSKRIEKAREITEKLTYNVQQVIDLHAANEIILYTDRLAKQIRPSIAAGAFKIFSDAQFRMEIIRLVSLWESAETNTVSILTVIELIDDQKVIEKLSEDIRKAHIVNGVRILNPHEDLVIRKEIEELIAAHQEEFANQQAKMSSEALSKAVSAAREAIITQEAKSVKNLRDHSSHSLFSTRRELAGFDRPMKYGEEKELLSTTVDLIEKLYCWVNGTSFDISGDCFELARERAKELWLNCRFEIPDT